MIRIVEDMRDVNIYLSLRKQVGWIKLDENQAQRAFTVYDDDKPIGMGRVVGDMAVISYIQDLIIIPEYQSKHIGSMLIEHIIAFVKGITQEGTRMMLCLMCAKGREIFYEKHGFIARQTPELGPGMIQYILQ